VRPGVLSSLLGHVRTHSNRRASAARLDPCDRRGVFVTFSTHSSHPSGAPQPGPLPRARQPLSHTNNHPSARSRIRNSRAATNTTVVTSDGHDEVPRRRTTRPCGTFSSDADSPAAPLSGRSTVCRRAAQKQSAAWPDLVFFAHTKYCGPRTGRVLWITAAAGGRSALDSTTVGARESSFAGPRRKLVVACSVPLAF